MRHREFIAFVGGAAAAWPRKAAAQNTAKSIRHLGVLLYSSPKEILRQERSKTVERSWLHRRPEHFH
jgi:hypothetical protein